MTSPLTKTAIVGFLGGLLGLIALMLPFGRQLELDVGLNTLFKVRGPRTVPPDVAIISLSPLPGQVTPWPSEPDKTLRSVHARLTKILADLGTAVIAFDIAFFESGPIQDDRLFAAAIREAGNVVLCEYVKSVFVPVAKNSGAYETLGVNIEKVLPPAPILARSAAALAPFPLPKVGLRVAQYWTFKSIPEETATLPVAVFKIYTSGLNNAFRRLLLSSAHSSILPLGTIAIGSPALSYAGHPVDIYRGVLRHYPQWALTLIASLRSPRFGDLSAKQKQLLRSMVNLCSTDKSRYLNLYGPPGTVPTFSYLQVIETGDVLKWNGNPFDLKGKAVFVGLSKLLRSEQKDGFHTFFPQMDGVDFSGVELAATAFANLAENLSVRPLSMKSQLVVVLLTAALLTLICWILPPPWAGAAALVTASAYFLVAYRQFKTAGLWMPLTSPILFQIPFIWLAATLWKYFDTYKERNRVKEAFGYYLPDHVVTDIAKDLSHITSSKKVLHGTCLLTDAERYTGLSETMDPQALGEYMNRYFATLFQPVKAQGGTISDVTGDAMLALWVKTDPDPHLRYRACLAALEISKAVHGFNRLSVDRQLPTRIGIHSGEVSIGNIGALDHYEYTPVGDVVNTTSRVEGLNRYLGTYLLVSKEVISGLNGLLTREIGHFLLAGKSQPVTIYELICRSMDATKRQNELCHIFTEVVTAYREQRWKAALESTQSALQVCPRDGPSLFYLALCRRYHQRPPRGIWDGIIRQETK